VTLNFDLLAPKFNVLISVTQYIIGISLITTFQDIVLTIKQSAVSSILYSTVTLPLTFSSDILLFTAGQ